MNGTLFELSFGAVYEPTISLFDLPCPANQGLGLPLLSSDLRPASPMPSKAFPWTCFASGLSTIGICVGSYSCFCSLANILLFLTLLAFCRRSMLERRCGAGPGEGVSPRANRFSALRRDGVFFAVAVSRLCQRRRGEELVSEALKGEDWNGEESNIFWLGVSQCLVSSSKNALLARTRGKLQSWWHSQAHQAIIPSALHC